MMAETEDYAQTPEAHHTSHEAGGSDEITIPPGPPEAHASSHEDAGADEIDCTGLTGRVNYVNRGDPSQDDWTIATLTADSLYHNLDCSGIVPTGAIAILLHVEFQATAIGKRIEFRKNGNSNTSNVLRGRQQVANIGNTLEGMVSCDENRVIQYLAITATWTVLTISIRGWLI